MKKFSKKIRRVWAINPRTRVKPAKKIYKRRLEKIKFKKEIEDDY